MIYMYGKEIAWLLKIEAIRQDQLVDILRHGAENGLTGSSNETAAVHALNDWARNCENTGMYAGTV